MDNLAFLGGREFEVWLAVGLTVSDRVRLCGVDDERMAEQSSQLPSCLLSLALPSLSEFQQSNLIRTYAQQLLIRKVFLYPQKKKGFLLTHQRLMIVLSRSKSSVIFVL